MSHLVDLVNRYYDAFNRRDLAAYATIFTPDAELVAPGMSGRGPDAMRGFDKAFQDAAPDARITVLRQAVTGALVISENRFFGTHKAPLVTPDGTIPVNGGVVDEPYVGVFEFVGERIRAQRIYFDRMGLLKALRAM